MSDTSQWETCEIELKKIREAAGVAQAAFVFDATVSGGRSARQSGEFVVTKESEVERLLRAFIRELTGDGWEPTGSRGRSWWSHRFRRRVR